MKIKSMSDEQLKEKYDQIMVELGRIAGETSVAARAYMKVLNSQAVEITNEMIARGIW